MDVVARRAAVARHLLQSCSFAHYVTSSSSVHLSMYYNTSGERGAILLFLSFNCFHFFNQIIPVRNVPCVLRQKTVRHLYATCTAPLLDSVASVTFVNPTHLALAHSLTHARHFPHHPSFYFLSPPKKDSSPWVECTHPDTGSPNRPSHTFGQPQGYVNGRPCTAVIDTVLSADPPISRVKSILVSLSLPLSPPPSVVSLTNG